jgi:hypothetical protein
MLENTRLPPELQILSKAGSPARNTLPTMKRRVKVLLAPPRRVVILSEAKNLSVVLCVARTATERFFASLRMTNR